MDFTEKWIASEKAKLEVELAEAEGRFNLLANEGPEYERKRAEYREEIARLGGSLTQLTKYKVKYEERKPAPESLGKKGPSAVFAIAMLPFSLAVIGACVFGAFVLWVFISKKIWDLYLIVLSWF